jgi:hypothetical protein
MKPFLPSGHAFVTFDSSVAADACIKKFQIGPLEYLWYFYQKLKDSVCCCFGRQNRNRSTHSTFFRFDDVDDLELKTKYEETVLSVRKVTEPHDILWKNLKGDKGHFIFRRLFIYTMGLVLILFVSTPIMVFANIRKADQTNFWTLDWAENIYGGQFIKTNLPALCVISINMILLFLIDFAALFEFQETHSLY